ncbi:MAG: hypothetical protein JKY37_18370 [Nannocystaceae bacterium]|nr:hypothetical protein [Nannocystaceae bacterium]
MLGRTTVPWTSFLTGAALAATLGCGMGCTKSEPVPQPPSSAAQSPATDSAAQQQEVALTPRGVADAPLLPVLNAAALDARVLAQRAVLGKRAVLFEDRSGRPVPWLSGTSASNEDSFDDDLLDSLPGSSGLNVGAVTGPSVNGNALGLFTPLEPDAEDGETPLAHFYAALRTLQTGNDPDGKVRILAYGASHTDADIYPHYLRSYLQQRFGDAGHGFVHIARPWNWYGHVDMRVEGLKRWLTTHAQRRKGIEDGMFGLMGASLITSSSKAFGRISPRNGTLASQFEIYFLEQPRGGSFKVYANGKLQGTVSTRAKTRRAGYYAFTLPEGEHTIEIRPVGNGTVRMFGMTTERDSPGVVVDTLGIGGTRAANMLAWDEAVWADNVSHRTPDLVMLAYGTNEATDSHADIAVYEADMREVMEKLGRVAPGASCIIIGGGDFPRKLDDGAWGVRPRVGQIRRAQREIAREYSCAFWDLHAFMGGDLSMTRWANANPSMAKGDHIHFTKRGYARMGMGLVDAIMVPFDGNALQ